MKCENCSFYIMNNGFCPVSKEPEYNDGCPYYTTHEVKTEFTSFREFICYINDLKDRKNEKR